MIFFIPKCRNTEFKVIFIMLALATGGGHNRREREREREREKETETDRRKMKKESGRERKREREREGGVGTVWFAHTIMAMQARLARRRHLGRNLNRLAPSPEPLRFSPHETFPPHTEFWPPEIRNRVACPPRTFAERDCNAIRLVMSMAALRVRWV